MSFRFMAAAGLACLLLLPQLVWPQPLWPQPIQPQGGDVLPSILGRTFKGTVRAVIDPPTGSGKRSKVTSGVGAAVLERPAKGGARLILTGTIDRPGDANFTALGRIQNGSWRAGAPGIELRIDRNGMVSGGGASNGNRMKFDGRYDGNDLMLTVEIWPEEATPGGLPEGTRFEFLYVLRHSPPGGRPSSAGNGGCREIVYSLKSTPNLFGGAMNMVRVPECRR